MVSQESQTLSRSLLAGALDSRLSVRDGIEEDGLGRHLDQVIAALLSQRGIEDAARACSVGTRTLIRWLKLPEFSAAYRDARRAAVSQSVARLQQATGAAVSTLLKVMVDPNTPASTKVRAADSVLDHSAKAIEIEDLEVRLTELERAVEITKDRRSK